MLPGETPIEERELADELHLALVTLQRQRRAGMGPPHHRPSPRRVIYFRSEVHAWLAAQSGAAGAPENTAAR